jgi:hypothetical protein
VERLRGVATALLVALAVVPAGWAAAPACPNVPLPERLAASDVAFVGRVVSSRPGESGRVYRFVVDQKVKGPVGREIAVRAPALTDAEGTPIVRDVAVGVLARLRGAEVVSDSCSLSDPGTLLATFDEPRGNAIKVSIVRRRRGTQPRLPRPSTE